MKLVVDPVVAHYDVNVGLARLRNGVTREGEAATVRVTTTVEGVTRSFTGAVEVSVEFGKLLLSYWSESVSEAWRVTAYACGPEAVRLAASRRLGAVRGVITLSGVETSPGPGTLRDRRREFFSTLCAMARNVLPGVRIPSRMNVDVSSRYCPPHVARVACAYQGAKWAVLGVGADESPQNVDAIAGAAMRLLTDAVAHGAEPFRRVLLFVPAGRAKIVAERLALVRAPLDLYAFHPNDPMPHWVAPAEQLTLATGPSRYLQAATGRTVGAAERALFQDAFGEDADCAEMTAPSRRETIRVLWNGLECARIHPATARRPARLVFGVTAAGERMRSLSRETESAFHAMRARLRTFRSATARDAAHALYRTHPERWLEAVVRRNPSALDARLPAQELHSQTPAFSVTAAGYADALGVTQEGRLAVIELKAESDANLLWQGLDYWRRVRAHAARGDFARGGLFLGARADASLAPALYLVAPMLRLPKSLRAACRMIDPGVPIRVVGLSERWRQELRAIFREEFP
jgi:hypothetical protein